MSYCCTYLSGEAGPLRCETCRAYINSFAKYVQNGEKVSSNSSILVDITSRGDTFPCSVVPRPFLTFFYRKRAKFWCCCSHGGEVHAPLATVFFAVSRTPPSPPPCPKRISITNPETEVLVDGSPILNQVRARDMSVTISTGPHPSSSVHGSLLLFVTYPHNKKKTKYVPARDITAVKAM